MKYNRRHSKTLSWLLKRNMAIALHTFQRLMIRSVTCPMTLLVVPTKGALMRLLLEWSSSLIAPKRSHENVSNKQIWFYYGRGWHQQLMILVTAIVLKKEDDDSTHELVLLERPPPDSPCWLLATPYRGDRAQEDSLDSYKCTIGQLIWQLVSRMRLCWRQSGATKCTTYIIIASAWRSQSFSRRT